MDSRGFILEVCLLSPIFHLEVLSIFYGPILCWAFVTSYLSLMGLPNIYNLLFFYSVSFIPFPQHCTDLHHNLINFFITTMYRYECARILIEKNEWKIYGGYVTGFLYAILSMFKIQFDAWYVCVCQGGSRSRTRKRVIGVWRNSLSQVLGLILNACSVPHIAGKGL